MPWLIYSTTYTYNWVDKVTVRVQCIVFLAQEHGTWPWPVPQILIMKNTGLNKELKFKHFQQSHQLSHCRQASSVINMAASQPCQWACLVRWPLSGVYVYSYGNLSFWMWDVLNVNVIRLCNFIVMGTWQFFTSDHQLDQVIHTEKHGKKSSWRPTNIYIYSLSVNLDLGSAEITPARLTIFSYFLTGGIQL